MKDPNYWKQYPVETPAAEIEGKLKVTNFTSGSEILELICFENAKNAANVLVSPGTAGHAYVFAELGYRIHARAYNVFIMPAHGGHTITQLVRRHVDALRHVAANYNERIGMFGEGLGGYVTFYVALDQGPVRSIVCQNAPAILTEARWHEAVVQGRGSAKRRKALLPIVSWIARVLPRMPLPIWTYLDFKEMVDSKQENQRIEAPLVEAYLGDPDFSLRYPLSAIMSLLSTPPPKPLAELNAATMFLVPLRGIVPWYFRDLFERLPPIKKKIAEVDGSAFWMVSHPRESANLICDWFDETL